MTPQLEISTEGALGVIVLNRPEAINALSLEMIEGISATLTGWVTDGAIKAVLFEGRGPKGFCAGGDVRAVRALAVGGSEAEATGYFAAEYRMNGLIATYPKPVVALTSGIVMGGGIGIAGHCGFRFTVPGARFAMPEAAIGFFSDVGVNAILAQAPLNRALLFEMAGVSVGAADAQKLGLADAVVAIDRAAEVRAGIVAAANAIAVEDVIVGLMQAESIIAGPTPFCDMADLLPETPPASPVEFLGRVKEIPALAEISALLEARSPTALTAIFHSQIAARRLMAVGPVLEMDLRLATLLARLPDFAEGVRAVLVDKDQRPDWRPKSLDETDPAPLLEAIREPGSSRIPAGQA